MWKLPHEPLLTVDRATLQYINTFLRVCIKINEVLKVYAKKYNGNLIDLMAYNYLKEWDYHRIIIK